MATELRPQTRKTRIVCISDTHCQMPRLPAGDVLIHAGDLTNQGSYSELKKAVQMLEKADFEAKIVVAGNHDITLDAQGFAEHGHLRKWPEPQDSEACRKLLIESKSITYLENEAAIIYLRKETGPRTCFSVYGSPCSPTTRKWGFGYEPGDAAKQWSGMPDADIVVTHAPPKGVCDTAVMGNEQVGCGALLEALHRIRPLLAVCGHIHEARGVEFVRWKEGPRGDVGLVEHSEKWRDSSEGSNRMALVNISAKNGRQVENGSRLTRHRRILAGADSHGGQNEALHVPQPCGPGRESTSGAGSVPQSEATFKALEGGAWEYRQGNGTRDVETDDDAEATLRRETVVVNAAVLGPRLGRKQTGALNKPIVVDVDLPLWHLDSDE